MKYARKAATDFESIIAKYFSAEAGRSIDYASTEPKQLFLDYLIQEKGIVVHGSNNTNLSVLTPNKEGDEGRSGSGSSLRNDR